MSGLSILALALTTVWVLASAYYLGGIVGWGVLVHLAPNEIGDYLAGFFAPLALLWIIVGFFQQGKELQLQRSELELQRKELELQRLETHRLANEAERQAKAVEANELHARRDTFIRVAELTEWELNSIAVNLVLRCSTPGHTDAIWDRYGKGDRGIFFSNAVTYLTGPRKAELIGRLDQYPDWPGLAVRYCEKFGRLMAQGTQCDPDGHLTEHFRNSFIGELYGVLIPFASTLVDSRGT